MIEQAGTIGVKLASEAGATTLQARIARAMTRIRYQLLGGILFGVLAPAVLRDNFERIADRVSNYDNSLIGTLCALLLGFLVFRKISALPGTGALLKVVPSFLFSYSAVAIYFFFLRLDYSRYQFAASFVFAVVWFLLAVYLIARSGRFSLFVVPGGAADRLTKIPTQIEWNTVTDPAMLTEARAKPIVVDLKNPKLSDDWERNLAEAAIAGRPVYNAKQLAENLTGRVQIEHLSENSFGHLAPDSIFAPAKRYFDTFFAFSALLFLSPIFLVVAIAIKLDSEGPVFFKQQRIGHRGKPFTVWKFRSMRVQKEGSDTLKSDMTKSDDDRITAVGRIIRKSRIDEFPQIINVLKGEMSWIGPRPETLNLSKWYEEEIPFYRYRHIVRPGITGWAQVKQGHVTTVDDVREKLEYDFYYIKHFSIWLDFLIVLYTLRVMISGHGSK